MRLRSGQAPWQRTWFTDTPHSKLYTSFMSVHSYHFSQSWVLVGGSHQSRRVRLIDAGAGQGDLTSRSGCLSTWESFPSNEAHSSTLLYLLTISLIYTLSFTLVQLIPLLLPLGFFSSLPSPILEIDNFSICMDEILPKSTKPFLEAD